MATTIPSLSHYSSIQLLSNHTCIDQNPCEAPLNQHRINQQNLLKRERRIDEEGEFWIEPMKEKSGGKLMKANTPTRHGVKVVLKAEEVRANPGHPRKWVKNPIPIQWINEKKNEID